MYCVEHADNKGKAMNFIVPEEAVFISEFNKNLLNGVVTLTGELPVITPTPDGSAVQTQKQRIVAIPYYAWANRGRSEMTVWLPLAT